MVALVLGMSPPTPAVATPSLYTLAPPPNLGAGIFVHLSHGAVLGVVFAAAAGRLGYRHVGRPRGDPDAALVRGGRLAGVAASPQLRAAIAPVVRRLRCGPRRRLRDCRRQALAEDRIRVVVVVGDRLDRFSAHRIEFRRGVLNPRGERRHEPAADGFFGDWRLNEYVSPLPKDPSLAVDDADLHEVREVSYHHAPVDVHPLCEF